ncbi:MAG: hypothetical protein FJ309_06030 [Planctomycetes bacterium]|nr:hypothetical protein [Planctomycetota bacterium]MBM4058040.1 hypothetical protein [Planctomycetota bacterium]
MDIRIERPHGACAQTGRPFVAGEGVYSALVRDGAALKRVDTAADAWTGPPPNCLAWWRGVHSPAPTRDPVAPVDVLLDLLEGLESRDDDAPLRYLLALALVRRRVLRCVDAPAAAERGVAEFACRRRDTTYRVVAVPADRLGDHELEARLAALLWPTEAAA